MVVLRLPHFSREIKCIGGEDVYVIKYQQRVKVCLQYCTESNARKKKKRLASQTATALFWQQVTGSGVWGGNKLTPRKRSACANATV